MPHETLLDRYFERTSGKGWQALRLREPMKPGFRTKRIAKLSDSLLLFTIGETELGRANGLDRTIASAIRGQGLRVEERPSTSGSVSRPKTYAGFNLTTATSAQVEAVLTAIIAAVRRVA
jgi:hypothetical protein